MLACENNKFNIVMMVLKALKINVNLKDKYGKTGFIYACSNNSLEVVELLLEKYPNIIN